MSGPKVVHKPTFPSRHLKAVAPPVPVPPPGYVDPPRTSNAKAHYGWGSKRVGAFWAVHYVSFAALLLTALVGAWFVYDRYHMAETQLGYAALGADLCRQPLLTVVEAPCTSGDLACFTEPQQALLKRYEAQARGANEWRAERCLPLL
jgi:hypothetical protein